MAAEMEDFRYQIKMVASTNLTLTVQAEDEDKDTLDSGEMKVCVVKQEQASVSASQVSGLLVEAGGPAESLTTTTKKRTML